MLRTIRTIINIMAVPMLVILILLWYRLISDRPVNPSSEGDFPSQPEWVYAAPGRINSTPVVIGNRMIIMGSNFICALNVRNGSELWCSRLSNGMSLSLAPLVVGDKIIAPQGFSDIGVYSIETGAQVWSTNAYDEGIKNFQPVEIEAVAFIDGKLFVARKNFKLSAYNLTTGEIAWSRSVPSRTKLKLAVDAQTVYLATNGGVYAYGSDFGEKRWVWQIKFQELLGPILLNKKTLYLATNYSPTSLIALDLDTREEKWKLSYLETHESEARSMVLLGDRLYLCGERVVAISTLTRKVIWVSEAMGWLEFPVQLGDHLYVRNTNTTLYSLDTETGQRTGSLLIQTNTPMKSDPYRGPVIADGLLIIPFGDKRLLAYRP